MHPCLRFLPVLSLLAVPAAAQGPLTPPGAPAPLMKTLDQIEPRTAVQSLAAAPPYIITQPGNYYLTGDIVTGGDGIVIRGSGTTLDLGGFNLVSTVTQGAAGNAISIGDGAVDVRIRNGGIRSGSTVSGASVTARGFAGGIVGESAFPSYSRVIVEDLRIRGVAGYAIDAQDGETSRCQVQDCAKGIYARTVRSCVAEGIGSSAIVGIAVVTDSVGSSIGDGVGVTGGAVAHSIGKAASSIGLAAETADHCEGSSSGSFGLYAAVASGCLGNGGDYNGIYALQAADCRGTSTNGIGLYAETAIHCSGISASGTGLAATTATGCYGKSNSIGLTADTAANCRAEGGNYGMIVISGDNCYGVSKGFNAGIQAENLTNCKGLSNGVGLRALANATNCYGKSLNDLGPPPAGIFQYGIWVDGTATSCRGDHYTINGTSLKAGIAVGCTSAQGGISSPSKQLGTP